MWMKILYISTLVLTVAIKGTLLWKQLKEKKKEGSETLRPEKKDDPETRYP